MAKLPDTATAFKGVVILGDADRSTLRAALHRHAVHHGKAQARSPEPYGWHARMTERARNLMAQINAAEQVWLVVTDPAGGEP